MYPLDTQELARERITELHSRAERHRRAHALLQPERSWLHVMMPLLATLKGAL
jgi:hypothetical protein